MSANSSVVQLRNRGKRCPSSSSAMRRDGPHELWDNRSMPAISGTVASRPQAIAPGSRRSSSGDTPRSHPTNCATSRRPASNRMASQAIRAVPLRERVITVGYPVAGVAVQPRADRISVTMIRTRRGGRYEPGSHGGDGRSADRLGGYARAGGTHRLAAGRRRAGAPLLGARSGDADPRSSVR